MKIILILICSIVITACGASNKGYPTLPDFSFMLLDSSTIMSTSQIPKGKPFILVYYDPDCRDCQDETRDILKHQNELSGTKMYFITDLQFSRMKLFNQVFKIDQHENIILGKDYSQSFYKLMKPTGTPYTIVYDDEKRMRAVFSGQAKIDDLIGAINKIK